MAERVSSSHLLPQEKVKFKHTNLETLLVFFAKRYLHRHKSVYRRGEPPCSPGQRDHENSTLIKLPSSLIDPIPFISRFAR